MRRSAHLKRAADFEDPRAEPGERGVGGAAAVPQQGLVEGRERKLCGPLDDAHGVSDGAPLTDIGKSCDIAARALRIDLGPVLGDQVMTMVMEAMR
jgi:hypothetical protein